MKTKLTLSVLLLLLLVVPSSVYANTTFDQNLGAPGWYDGSGNPNGGFTVDNENGILLGIRIKLRQDPNVIDSATDVYNVPYGAQIGSPTHAAWNYEFAIFDPNLLLGDTFSLTITNQNTLATATVNPLTYWSDDSGFGPGGKTNTLVAGDTAAEQSENPIFGDFPLAGSYNELEITSYKFELVAKDHLGNIIGDVAGVANVQAPEPSTFLLLGGALVLVALQRRKQTS